MKRIFFSIGFLSLCAATYAQKFNDTEIFKVQSMLYANKDKAKNLESAKESLDKFAADQQNAGNKNLEMYRFMTYSRLFADTVLNEKYANAGDVAYGIFKTQQASFSGDTAKFNALLRNNNLAGVDGLGNIYTRNFNLALKDFNAQNYEAAYQHFSRAEEASDYILQNGFSQGNRDIDTMTVLYTGFAAQNIATKNPVYADSAAIYYKKLIIDRNVATSEMAPAYQFMIERSLKNKDKATAEKLTAVAKQHYPDYAGLWSKFEMDATASGASTSDLVKKYNEADASGKLDENAYLNFAETLSAKEVDALPVQEMIAAKGAGANAYGKLFEKTKDITYGLNAAIVNYQIFNRLEDEYRASAGQSADLKAKRDKILTDQQKYADESIKWYQVIVPMLENKTDKDRREVSYLKNAYRNLTNIFEWKANKARGVQPQLVDKYEAEFNKYNKLFDAM